MSRANLLNFLEKLNKDHSLAEKFIQFAKANGFSNIEHGDLQFLKTSRVELPEPVQLAVHRGERAKIPTPPKPFGSPPDMT